MCQKAYKSFPLLQDPPRYRLFENRGLGLYFSAVVVLALAVLTGIVSAFFWFVL